MASDLPDVGLNAVIENLANFQKGADAINQAYQQINEGADSVEESTGAASGALNLMGGAASTVATGGMALLVTAAAAALAAVAALGVGLAATAKAAFDVSKEMEDASNAIIIGTGASGESLAEMEDIVKNLSESSAGARKTYGEMGEVVAAINTRLGLTGAALEEASAAALQFSRVTGEDAVSATQLATRVMGDWGLESDQLSGTLDTLFGASQAFGISTDSLSQKVVQFGAPLRQMGFTLEESIALFGKWEKEGVNAELAIGSLRIAAGKFAKDNVPLREGLDQTMEAIKNASSESEGLAIAMETFGARAGPDMAAAIREGRFELDSAITALQGTQGNLQDAADRTLTFGDKWGVVMNRARNALLPFGDSMLESADEIFPLLEQAVDDLRPAIQEMAILFRDWLTKAVQELIPWVQNNLIPALTEFGKWMVSTGLPALRDFAEFVWKEVIPAIAQFAEWVGDELIPFIKALWKLFKDSKKQGKTVVKAFDAILDAIEPLIKKVLPKLIDLWDIIKKWTEKNWPLIQKTIETVMEAIQDVIEKVTKAIQKFWERWGDDILAYAEWIFDSIYKVIKTSLENVLDIISAIMKVITGDWQGAWDDIQKVVERTLSTVKDIIKNGFDVFLKIVKDVMGDIVDRVKSAWDDLKSRTESALSSLRSSISNIWNQISSNVQSIVTNMINSVVSRINAAVSTIRTAILNMFNNAISSVAGAIGSLASLYSMVQNLINSIRDRIMNLWSTIRDGITNAISAALNAFNINSVVGYIINLATAIMNTIKARLISLYVTVRDGLSTAISTAINLISIPFTSLYNIGRNIIQGVIDGINSAKSKLRDILEGVADAIPGWLRDWLGIGSPAKIMIPIGKSVVEGLQAGIMSQVPSLMGQLQNQVAAPMVAAPALGASTTSNVTNIFNTGGNTIANTMDAAVFEQRVLQVIRRNL